MFLFLTIIQLFKVLSKIKAALISLSFTWMFLLLLDTHLNILADQSLQKFSGINEALSWIYIPRI